MSSVDRFEFLERRRMGVGGSDVAAVLNMEPYGCARKLWYEKTGAKQDYPSRENDAMARGVAMEPIIADMFAAQTGFVVKHIPDTIVSESQPWMQVHVDRFVYEQEGGEPGVVEEKSLGRESFLKIKREGIPDAYILQVQHGMFVCEMNYGYFAGHCCDFWTQLLFFRIEADRELQTMVARKCEEFWLNHVEKGDPPARLDPSDKRCAGCEYRTSCQGAHMVEVMNESGFVETDNSLSELLANFLELRDIAEAADAEKDWVAMKIKEAIGDRTAIEAKGARAYYRPHPRSSVDSKAIAAGREPLADAVRGLEGKLTGADVHVMRLKEVLASMLTPKVAMVRPLKVYPK